jgi:hypothetical protein
MVENSKLLNLKMLAIALAISTFGLSAARADIDPAICGLGGALGGGAIGSQFGGGDGKTIMTIIGAIAGAAAAHNYCKQAENPEDIQIARQNEREMLMRGNQERHEWSNPRYGRQPNAHSQIERRGWYGNSECTMTRSVMQSSDGGRYVNETYWCNERGNWSQVTETTTIRQIQWGANGPVQSTTTETTTIYRDGRPPMPPPPMAPAWIVGENRIVRFQTDLERDWAHPERAARDIASDLARSQQFITLDQLGLLLGKLRFDSERANVLREIAIFVDQQFGSISSVTRVYDFERGAEEARRVLDQVQREKQIGPHRDGRGGRRWEERRDGDREEWRHRR